jgi:hypothetical protein
LASLCCAGVCWTFIGSPQGSAAFVILGWRCVHGFIGAPAMRFSVAPMLESPSSIFCVCIHSPSIRLSPHPHMPSAVVCRRISCSNTLGCPPLPRCMSTIISNQSTMRFGSWAARIWHHRCYLLPLAQLPPNRDVHIHRHIHVPWNHRWDFAPRFGRRCCFESNHGVVVNLISHRCS